MNFEHGFGSNLWSGLGEINDRGAAKGVWKCVNLEQKQSPLKHQPGRNGVANILKTELIF